MNETFDNLISYSPAPEPLTETKVLTANSPVEFGNVNSGGMANVLKSGTNQFSSMTRKTTSPFAGNTGVTAVILWSSSCWLIRHCIRCANRID